jgi:hypothetical protein
MNYGYFIAPSGDAFGFGQILPPLSTTRGFHREQRSGGYVQAEYNTGTWWIATDVVDNGNGQYDVYGDYVSNLAGAVPFEDGMGNTQTTNGLFKAVPVNINNRIVSAYIPTSFTINNVVVVLSINPNTKELEIEKGSVTFEPWINGQLFTQEAVPSLSDVSQDSLAMRNARISADVLGGQGLFVFLPFLSGDPLIFRHEWRRGYGTRGIYYKAASDCAWCYEYPGSSYNLQVGLAEDMAKWLKYLYEHPLPPGYGMSSPNAYCNFEYQADVPDYVEFV